MPIVFTCLDCGRKMQAPDAAAGEEAECPHCLNFVPVPRRSERKAKPAKAPTARQTDIIEDGFAAPDEREEQLRFKCLGCKRMISVRTAGEKVRCPECGERHTYGEVKRESRKREERKAWKEGRLERWVWYTTAVAVAAAFLGTVAALASPSGATFGFIAAFVCGLGFVMSSLSCFTETTQELSASDRGIFQSALVFVFIPFLVIHALYRVGRFPQLTIMMVALATVLLASGRAHFRKPKPDPQPPIPAAPGNPNLEPNPRPNPGPQPEPKFVPPGPVPDASDVPGLVSYWRFDEGAGTVARDANSEAAGTLRDAKWVDGVRGKALDFDGAAAWFDFGDAAALNVAAGAPATVCCWVKPRSKYGPVFTFRGKQQRLTSTILGVWLENGKLCAWVRSDVETGEPNELFGRTELVPDEWHHVALTRHPDGTVELFQDGTAVARRTARASAGTLTTQSRALGWERNDRLKMSVSNGPQHKRLAGAIDEFAVFGRALSAADIAKLAGR